MVNILHASIASARVRVDTRLRVGLPNDDLMAYITRQLAQQIAESIVHKYIGRVKSTPAKNESYVDDYVLEFGVFDLETVPDHAISRTPHERVLVELTGWKPMQEWKWSAEVNGGMEFLYRHDGGKKFSVSTQMQVWEAVFPTTMPLVTNEPIDPTSSMKIDKREIYPVAWRMKAP